MRKTICGNSYLDREGGSESACQIPKNCLRQKAVNQISINREDKKGETGITVRDGGLCY
jgi:hypothetical protein